jgi:hypothetical protein
MAASLLAALAAAGCLTLSGGWFTDVTGGSGIPPLKYAEGANFRDLDGDGLPELFLPVVKGRDRLFKNLGGCRFRDITDASGIVEKGGIGAVFADFDGDGISDLYVVRGAYPYGLNILYRGLKGGGYKDISQEAVAGRKNGISASAADFDGDGRADIFVSNWGANTLYKNETKDGKIAFEDVAAKAGVYGEARNWGSVVSDLNGDGLPDVVVLRGGNGKGEGVAVYMNKGGGLFEDRTASSGISGVKWSMGAVSADFDGDGSFDLFICNYDGPDRLFLNDGKGVFRDATEGSGISSGHSVGAAAGCIDGDLLPDLVVGEFTGHVVIYKNLGGGRFQEVKSPAISSSAKNEGVALADIDNDGDNRLYRNDTQDGNFLKVRTTGGFKPGTVARLYKAGMAGERAGFLAVQEMHSVYGFCSQGPAEFLFRLPDKGPYDLSVVLPGGRSIERRGIMTGTIDINGTQGPSSR